VRPGVYVTRRCLFCAHDVPDIAWRDDRPGGHLVIVHDNGGFRLEGGTIDADGTIKVVASENVRLMLCRDITTVAATGLGRAQQAVDAARRPQPPDRPVTLCGEFDPTQTYWIGDRRVDPVSAVEDLRPWAGARGFWRWVAERLFAS
jgi:hypothetical protein